MTWTNILLISLGIILFIILRHIYRKRRLTLSFLVKLLSSGTEQRERMLVNRIYNHERQHPNNMVFASYQLGMIERVSFSGSLDYINNYNKELGTSIKPIYGADSISYSSNISRISKLVKDAEAKGYSLINTAGEVYQNGNYLLNIIWTDKKMAKAELSKKIKISTND